MSSKIEILPLSTRLYFSLSLAGLIKPGMDDDKDDQREYNPGDEDIGHRIGPIQIAPYTRQSKQGQYDADHGAFHQDTTRAPTLVKGNG